MCSETVLSLHNVGKAFKRFRRLRDRLFELVSGRNLHTDFVALQPLSFSLQPGTILGIIGENGSGKSTLLKLIAGILIPDCGVIRRQGRVTGLLELGTGFNMDLSGRSNIAFNGLYLGLSAQEIREREQAIIDFSELAEAIDEPLKSYSSGMVMRLGFSIAIHARPDCFLIDEALAVGDVRFQQKCFEFLRSYTARGGSIIFVSHDLNAVKLLCDTTMLLHKGKMLYLGSPDTAVHLYHEAIAPKDCSQTTISGFGNGYVTFTRVALRNAQGQEISTITSGQALDIVFHYACHTPTKEVSFGITIRDRYGQDVFGTNGAILGLLTDVGADGTGCFHFPEMNISPGFYTVNLAAHTGTTHLEHCFHWWDKATSFEVHEDPHYFFGGHTRLAVSLSTEEEKDARL